MLKFYNNDEEPLSTTRQILVTLHQPYSVPTVNCSIIVSMMLINDHVPTVDLRGLDSDEVNYTTSIISQYQGQNRVLIADKNSSITDLDSESVLVSMSVSLVSHIEGDALVFDIGGCNPSGSTGTCYVA